MNEDPIVTEMRNAGRKSQEESGNDPDRLFAMLLSKQEERRKEGWIFLTRIRENEKAVS